MKTENSSTAGLLVVSSNTEWKQNDVACHVVSNIAANS